MFSLPVTDTAGLRLMEEDEAQPEAALDPLKIDLDIRIYRRRLDKCGYFRYHSRRDFNYK